MTDASPGSKERSPADCVYGDAHADTTIVLIGDSHAGHWFPAFNVLAKRNGWRLIPLVKASCPFIDMRRVPPICRARVHRMRRLAQRARSGRPTRPVLISSWWPRPTAGSGRSPRPTRSAKAQGEAMAREIDRLQAPVAIIVDTPRTNADVPGCLSRHPTDVHECAIPRSEAFHATFGVQGAHRCQALRRGDHRCRRGGLPVHTVPGRPGRDDPVPGRTPSHRDLRADPRSRLRRGRAPAPRTRATGTSLPRHHPSMPPVPAASPSASARPTAAAAPPTSFPTGSRSAAAVVARADVGPASAGLGGHGAGGGDAPDGPDGPRRGV